MDESPLIKFRCENCGQRISVPQIYTGRKSKCPNCKNTVVVPLTGDSDHSGVPLKSLLDPAMFDVPPGQAKEQKPSAPDVNQSSPHNTEAAPEPILDVTVFDIPPEPAEPEKTAVDYFKKVEEPPPERKFPFLLDIFLYPLNLAGIIHLICLWLLVFLFCPLVIEFLGLGIEYIPVVYTLPVAYVLYYFAECIRDSATGNCRAPDFWMHPNEDKWDCISRLLTVIGCIAVCFCPASVYYVVTERTNSIYWLLLACGGFFFPMVLLAVVLFDSFNALNPILIIGSIFRTFLPYCGMVLLFYGGALLFMKIDSPLYQFQLLPAVSFIYRALQLYLMFVAVGLLGSFYWRYKEKLNWDV
jgi:DNA-directed RNA polymerase subunit RPC12/RpoP